MFTVFLAKATALAVIGQSLLVPGVTDPDAELRAGERAFIDVTVGTLWVKPATARAIDKPSLGDPVNLDAWNRNLDTTAKRQWLTGKVETQAVYGSEVRVKEIKGGWARVTVTHQSTPRDTAGYPGWIPVTQLTEDEDFAAQAKARARAVVTAKTTKLTGDGASRPVSFGTVLPVLARGKDAVRVLLPGGGGAWMPAADAQVLAPGKRPPKPSGAALVATGKKFLGLRYVWAGVSSYGFDCSGFTSAVYRSHGIDIPRDASAQIKKGAKVSRLKAGDLLFFATRSGTVHHVGMYIGEGKMIHSPNASKTVEIVDWKAWDAKGEFAGARRYL